MRVNQNLKSLVSIGITTKDRWQDLEITLNKIKEKLKARPPYPKEIIEKRNAAIRASAKTCEYCGKTCVLANYNRWHGDNCKKIKGII